MNIMNTITDSGDNIVTRWEMSGLLDDVPDKDRKALAHSLHACLLHLTDDEVEPQICGLLLPGIRRVYDMSKEVTIHFKELQKLIEEKLSALKDDGFYSGADYEMNALTDACEEYVKEK